MSVSRRSGGRISFRWRRAAVAAATVLAVAGAAAGAGPALAGARPSAASRAPGSSGWQQVTAYGVSLRVPVGWPVVDLRRDPAHCVRFDVHAVYLGAGGQNPACPAHLAGKTEAVQIQRLAPRNPDVLRATARSVLGGQPMRTDPHWAEAGLLTDVLGSVGAEVSISYGQHAALARQIQSTLRVTAIQHASVAPPAHPQVRANLDAQPQGPFQGLGFDTCSAPSADVMQAWLASPYRAVGIYIGGANRSCGQPSLTSSWIGAIGNQGWHPVPIYVGLQAPCASQPGLATIDPGSAASEGAQAADDAVAQAQNLGLPAGTAIYNDMEYYSGGCSSTVLAFLAAWTTELHNRGYTSGVYESASNVGDILNSGVTQPDQVYYANWDGRAVTTGDQYIPDSAWANHQRIHQYQGGHTETWGNASISIDNDALDATLGGGAGPSPAAASPAVVYDPKAGHLEVYARGTDGTLWERYFDGYRWSAWLNLSGGITIAGDPAVVYDPKAGHLEVYARGTDGTLWERYFDGYTWSAWLNLQGGLAGDPAVVYDPKAGHVEVYVRGTDGSLWERYFDGYRWSAWLNLQGGLAGDPAVVYNPNGGHLEVYVRGTDAGLWERYFDGYTWAPWINLKGALG